MAATVSRSRNTGYNDYPSGSSPAAVAAASATFASTHKAAATTRTRTAVHSSHKNNHNHQYYFPSVSRSLEFLNCAKTALKRLQRQHQQHKNHLDHDHENDNERYSSWLSSCKAEDLTLHKFVFLKEEDDNEEDASSSLQDSDSAALQMLIRETSALLHNVMDAQHLQTLAVLVQRRGFTHDNPTADIQRAAQLWHACAHELTHVLLPQFSTLARSVPATIRIPIPESRTTHNKHKLPKQKIQDQQQQQLLWKRHVELVMEWFQDAAAQQGARLQQLMQTRGQVLAEQAQRRQRFVQSSSSSSSLSSAATATATTAHATTAAARANHHASTTTRIIRTAAGSSTSSHTHTTASSSSSSLTSRAAHTNALRNNPLFSISPVVPTTTTTTTPSVTRAQIHGSHPTSSAMHPTSSSSSSNTTPTATTTNDATTTTTTTSSTTVPIGEGTRSAGSSSYYGYNGRNALSLGASSSSSAPPMMVAGYGGVATATHNASGGSLRQRRTHTNPSEATTGTTSHYYHNHPNHNNGDNHTHVDEPSPQPQPQQRLITRQPPPFFVSRQQRAREARQAEASLVELGTVFGKMSTLIAHQSEQLQSIEDDVEAACHDLTEGQYEIQTLYALKKGNRMLIIKTFGLLIFFIVFMRLYKSKS